MIAEPVGKMEKVRAAVVALYAGRAAQVQYHGQLTRVTKLGAANDDIRAAELVVALGLNAADGAALITELRVEADTIVTEEWITITYLAIVL